MNSKAKKLLSLQSLEFDEDKKNGNNSREKTIEKLRSAVSAQTLHNYDIKKKRYGSNSVVAIENGHCSGCNVSLSLKTVRESNSHVVECEHCGRLLYNPKRHKRLVIEVAAA
ncbi:MAG: hypothetical protein ACLFUS_04895 [Candidatus Sumerlaeia bacterium]